MKELLPVIIALVAASVVFVWLWRQGAFLKVSGYFDATKDELKRCTWPTWEELTGSTAVVLVSVAFLGGFTVGVDFVMATLVKLLV